MAKEPKADAKEAPEAAKTEQPKKPETCGLVMPISATDGCSEQHWADVKGILFAAIRKAGLEPQLVSDADDVGIIQKRIVQNLYDNPIVVCDVSGKNANVMFELGMRLAFDKPTIIVKDNATTYSFDTAPIEHLGYPRDLRFAQIVKFQETLADKIKGTLKAFGPDRDSTTFLKHFGEFKVARVETKEVPRDDYVVAELGELKNGFRRMASELRRLSGICRAIGVEPLVQEDDDPDSVVHTQSFHGAVSPESLRAQLERMFTSGQCVEDDG